MADTPDPDVCGNPVGKRPWWLGEDQWDPCYCLLPLDHEGGCECSHTWRR